MVVDGYRDAAVMIFEPLGRRRLGWRTCRRSPTRAGFHLRGQSSSIFPQKPYKVEFCDNPTRTPSIPIAGMPADADWALIAPYYDRSLIRNPFTYTLGREWGYRRRARPIRRGLPELTANRPDQRGRLPRDLLVLRDDEDQQDRLDLAKLKATDLTAPEITGGYIFKFDYVATDATAPHLTCTGSDVIVPANSAGTRPPAGVNCWIDCEIADPVPLRCHEQLAWLTQYVQRSTTRCSRRPSATTASTSTCVVRRLLIVTS